MISFGLLRVKQDFTWNSGGAHSSTNFSPMGVEWRSNRSPTVSVTTALSVLSLPFRKQSFGATVLTLKASKVFGLKLLFCTVGETSCIIGTGRVNEFCILYYWFQNWLLQLTVNWNQWRKPGQTTASSVKSCSYRLQCRSSRNEFWCAILTSLVTCSSPNWIQDSHTMFQNSVILLTRRTCYSRMNHCDLCVLPLSWTC